MKTKLSKLDTVMQSITHCALDNFYKHDIEPGEALEILEGIRLFIVKRLFDVDFKEAKTILKGFDAESNPAGER